MKTPINPRLAGWLGGLGPWFGVPASAGETPASPYATRFPTRDRLKAGLHALSRVCLASAFLTTSVRADLSLVKDGQATGCIVLSTNALASEAYAAHELQHYLEAISGVRIKIVNVNDTSSGPQILIGDGALRSRSPFPSDLAKLGPEDFILRSGPDYLIIAGGKPRGTLYGVYTLLEEKLGVRWFTPELEYVPHRNSISLPALDETRSPAFVYREVYWTEMMRDADFAARHRLNGNSYRLAEKHGGRGAVYFPFVHSFDSLIPQELYAQHPEYFPLVNGKRLSGYVQRCLSNPEVLKLAIARVRQWIKDHPEASIISVSQNDTGKWCQCSQCKALDDAEGSPAASLLQFVNTIARDIETDFPAVRIDTLAYQYTRKPPKTIRPRSNVVVRLCSIECCFAHPLATCPSPANRRFRDDILAWEKVAPALYVWDYTPNFAHYQQPFPNFDSLQPNVRFFSEHNVKGLFEQGNYSAGGQGELGPLRAYVLAELLWRPDADVRTLTTEFLQAYYGSAAPRLQAYLDLLQQQVRGDENHARIYDPPKAAYLNDSFLQRATILLDEAEQMAGTAAERSRVRIARLPVWYVQLATQRLPSPEREARLKEFLEVARQAGITHINEGQALKAWAKAMGAD